MGGEQTSIDTEGGVRGPDSTRTMRRRLVPRGYRRDHQAIAGGGKGAAIGAIIGGGAGGAAVMTQRGKDIRLDRGQQLKIRTSTTGLQ